MTPTKITVNATINAPIEKVWKAWTDTQDIVKWNTPSPDWHTPRAENDVTPGGKFLYRMEAKDGNMGFDFGGVYDMVDTNKRIEYTIGDGRKVENIFTQDGNSIHVETIFDAETVNPVDFQKAGWQAIMDSFKNYVENN